MVGGLPGLVRRSEANLAAGDRLAVAAGRLDEYGDRLPGPLPGLLGQRWFAARIGRGRSQP